MPHRTLDHVDAARRRVAATLTVAMMVLYFGFILLVAYGRSVLARVIAPGLSVGILLGALVIFGAWALVLIYVAWANRHYDHAVAALKAGRTDSL
jgi:uncharacterized membrane protein (DUF485 family)